MVKAVVAGCVVVAQIFMVLLAYAQDRSPFNVVLRAMAWSTACPRRNHVFRRHGQVNRETSLRLTPLLGSLLNLCSMSGTIEGDWPSNS